MGLVLRAVIESGPVSGQFPLVVVLGVVGGLLVDLFLQREIVAGMKSGKVACVSSISGELLKAVVRPGFVDCMHG